jgi:comEA protein
VRSLPQAGWFSVSSHELLVLATAVGLALLVAAATSAARRVWGPREPVVIERGSSPLPPARIDINTAEHYELELLPGIGPATAQAIIDDRTANGPFTSLEDLARVKGIGPATVESVRPHAMCRPARADPGAGGDDG